MSRGEKNPDKYVNYSIINDNEGKLVLKSQMDAVARYEKAHPTKTIGIRVTPEAKKLIDEYVTRKAKEENKNPTQRRKYSTDLGRPSLNTLIIRLLEDEMGVGLTPDKEDQ